MDRKEWTKEQRVALIIEALGREDLSPEYAELIQGWLVRGEEAGGENALMDAILDRMFEFHDRPTDRARESFARLSARLGLPRNDARVSPRVPLRRVLLRVAAVLVPLLVLGGGAIWYFAQDPAVGPVVATMVEAVRDEGGVVRLPDGSIVRTVGGSRVTVAENFGENRRVVLSGEAFFSVARDPGHPFTVRAQELTITVTGTEFNIEAWGADELTEVSLVSGSVEIESGGRSVELAPMERLVYNRVTGQSDVDTFTPGQIDRWRFGKSDIDDMSLERALGAVGDFYGLRVVIEGDLPTGLGVTTVLSDRVTPQAALEAIRLINDAFEYDITGDTIRIVGKR